MISVCNLEKRFSNKTLFADASFHLNAGSRYGLVGANGSGKSTLLRILAGQETASSGELIHPKSMRMGYLQQDQFINDDGSIVQCVMQGNEAAYAALLEKDRLLSLSSPDPHALFEAEERIRLLEAFRLKAKAAEILEGLGIASQVHENPLKTLSGGYKLRVLLGKVLLSNPDFLLLDEPTNHLDILTVRWLEKFLQKFRGCLLVISHDRRFLDQVATHTLDVDYETVTLYTGNYSEFVLRKEQIREQKEAEIRNIQRDIAHKQAFVDRFRAKASKARQAQSRVKQLEKIELPEIKASSRKSPLFRFECERPSGQEVLKLKNINKSYGEKQVLRGVGFEVRRGEKVAIIGPNGVGKSTLLRILAEEDRAFSGQLKWGFEAGAAYFSQDHDVALRKFAGSIENWLWQFCPEQPLGFVKSKLGSILFTGDDTKKSVSALSGGELSRLELARLMMRRANVLILDEPTNHLDMEAIEALVSGLSEYEGTLIFVSHDRYFVSYLATSIVEITPTQVQHFKGTYDEYLEKLGDDHLDVPSVPKSTKSTVDLDKVDRIKRYEESKLQQKQLRSLEKKAKEIESQIQETESSIREIYKQFEDPSFFDPKNSKQVAELNSKVTLFESQVELLYTELEDVEFKIESINSA